MTTQIKPIPDGCHTVTPYLTVHVADAALAFYKKAFGASEVIRLHRPDGKVGHAEFKIGESHFMISDEYPNPNSTSPHTLGGTSVKLHLYVSDADAVFSQAIAAGAKETMPVENQFWGDRMGSLIDPFGHHWLIATHVEDIDPSELQGRMEAFFAANQSRGN
ncbi:MAG: VOC family protein [Methylomonas sp.]|nr:VOC family protein [Methylomonas sp.]